MIRQGCQYPGCARPAAGGRGQIGGEPGTGVELCAEHLTVVDARDWTPTTQDFWRWFHARTSAVAR